MVVTEVHLVIIVRTTRDGLATKLVGEMSAETCHSSKGQVSVSGIPNQ